MNQQAKALLKKNNELEKQLTPEAAMLMRDIIVYIRGANISDFHQESMRYDILQMVLDGEKRGDCLQDIIGENLQAFCDEVLSEVPQLTAKERILSMISLSCLCLSALSFMWMIYMGINVVKGNLSLPYLPVTVGQAVSAVVIIIAAIFLYRYVTKTSFDKNALNNKVLFVVCFLFVLSGILLNYFMTSILLTLHMYVVLLIIIILYIVYRVIDRNL